MKRLRPTCRHCMYWIADATSETSTAGHCHRYPPGVFIKPETGVIVQKFPMTDHHQWCGEWSDDDATLVDAARRALSQAVSHS